MTTILPSYRADPPISESVLLKPSASSDDPRFEPAGSSDVPALASLHASAIREGFLSSLGPRFLRRLYAAMVESRSVVVLVARAPDGRSVSGFVSGAVSPGSFYREFLRRHGVAIAPIIGPRALRPTVARRLLETLRHVRRAGKAPEPELLSIAVHPAYRRQGMGSRLIDALEAELKRAGARRLFVVVGAENGQARALYEQHGFTAAEDLEVHRGVQSIRYRKGL